MNPDVYLRRADAADLPTVSRFVLAICERELFAWFDEVGRDRLREIYALESLQAQLKAGGDFVLAEKQGDLVGAVAMRSPAHITLLFVSPGHRRRGLGAKLMRRVMALRQEAKRITLNAHLEAVPFYESLGFQARGCECEEDGLRFLPMTLERCLNRGGSGL